jgi:hypothetical protein
LPACRRTYQDLSLPTNTSASISTATDTAHQHLLPGDEVRIGREEEGIEEEGRREEERKRNAPTPGPSLYLNTPTSKLSSPPPSLNIDFNLNCLSNPIGGRRGVPMCFLFDIWDRVVAIRPGGSSGPRGCLVVFLGWVGERGVLVNGIIVLIVNDSKYGKKRREENIKKEEK